MSRRRIALFMPGSLGPASSSMYVPALNALVEDLSREHDIVAFNLVRRDNDRTSFSLGRAWVEFLPTRYDDSPVKKFASFLRAFRREHAAKPFDAVHGFWGVPAGTAACVAGKLFRIPSFVTLQGGEGANLPMIRYGNMRPGPLRQVTLWTASSATRLVALSPFQMRTFRHEGFKRKDVLIIPYGADKRLFLRELSPSINMRYVRFLHVGDTNLVKDHPTLLRTFAAIARVLPCSLRVIGEDTLGGAMRQLAAVLHIADQVEFLGHVPHITLPEHFERSDVYLHTSLFESGSVAVAEAALNGLLLAGTRVGILDHLADNAAIAVAPGDAAGLARKILLELRAPERVQELRSRAQQWACAHDRAWTATQYDALYSKVGKDRHAG